MQEEQELARALAASKEDDEQRQALQASLEDQAILTAREQAAAGARAAPSYERHGVLLSALPRTVVLLSANFVRQAEEDEAIAFAMQRSLSLSRKQASGRADLEAAELQQAQQASGGGGGGGGGDSPGPSRDPNLCTRTARRVADHRDDVTTVGYRPRG
jgi:uncharacterized membrane protein YgcG